MPTAIVDSSVAVALAAVRDPEHATVVRSVAGHVGALLLPEPAVTETAIVLGRRYGPAAEQAFVAGLSGGPWRRVPIMDADIDRAADLMARYADARLGFVDAAIVAVAERQGVTRIYTLDRRDFSLVRPRHLEAFEILP